MTDDSITDSITDSIADHPVGMAYLLGNWPTIAGRLESPGDWLTVDKHV